MQTKIKIILSLLSAIGIIFLLSTINLSINIKVEREEKEKIKNELLQTVKEKKAIKKDLEEITRVKIDTQLKLAEEKGKTKILETKIDYEKEQRKLLTAKLKKKKEKIEELLTELEKRKQKESKLSKLLNKIKQEKEKLALQLKEREKKGIILDKIVVRPKEFCPVDLRGEVLIVNDEFNFLMIDLGKKDGLSAGTILGVYQDKKLLGKIRTEEVYTNISEATVLPVGLQPIGLREEKNIISEGDEVRSFINSDYAD